MKKLLTALMLTSALISAAPAVQASDKTKIADEVVVKVISRTYSTTDDQKEIQDKDQELSERTNAYIRKMKKRGYDVDDIQMAQTQSSQNGIRNYLNKSVTITLVHN